MFLLKEAEKLQPSLPISGRILGVDFGLKQQGIAIGESDTYNVQPLAIIRARSRKKSINAVLEIIAKWQVRIVVFGYPMQQEGQYYKSNSAILMSLEKYIQTLQKQYKLPVFLFNEHFSSQQARYCNKLTLNQREYSQIDDLAATIILQNWFANLAQLK